jgi:ceramide glucosyltransferase
VLDEIGGFLGLSNYLADDFFLGNRAARAGYQLSLCGLMVETVLPPSAWSKVIGHQLRWARTYRSVRPGSYFAMALSHGMFWALLNVMVHPGSLLAWSASLGLAVLRVATASVVANRYLQAPTPWYEALLVLPKDLLAAAIWFAAFMGNSVHWSGHDFHILSNGEMVRRERGERVAVALPAYRTGEERESL